MLLAWLSRRVPALRRECGTVRRRPGSRPAVEVLEERALLSGGPNAPVLLAVPTGGAVALTSGSSPGGPGSSGGSGNSGGPGSSGGGTGTPGGYPLPPSAAPVMQGTVGVAPSPMPVLPTSPGSPGGPPATGGTS